MTPWALLLCPSSLTFENDVRPRCHSHSSCHDLPFISQDVSASDMSSFFPPFTATVQCVFLYHISDNICSICCLPNTCRTNFSALKAPVITHDLAFEARFHVQIQVSFLLNRALTSFNKIPSVACLMCSPPTLPPLHASHFLHIFSSAVAAQPELSLTSTHTSFSPELTK